MTNDSIRRDPSSASSASGGRYVLARLSSGLYAVEAASVVEMMTLGDIAPHPHGGPLVRGVTRVRGRLVPVVDTRRLMGMTPVAEERRALEMELDRHEADHGAWVRSLEAAIEARTPFGGATDARTSAFARWVAGHRSGRPRLDQLVEAFRGPLERLHAAAAAAVEHQRRGDHEAAHRTLCREVHRDLARVRSTFQRVRSHLREEAKETVVCVAVDGTWRGLTVDMVEAVSPLARRGDADLSGRGFVREIATAPGRAEGVFVLDLRGLLSGRAAA